MFKLLARILTNPDAAVYIARYSYFIFTQTRASERAAVNAFIAAVTPQTEEVAAQRGYTVTFEIPQMTISTDNKFSSYPSRVRQNLNTRSKSTIDVIFQHKENPEDTLRIEISIDNRDTGHKITYRNNTNDKIMYEGRAFLDYAMRDKTELARMLHYAKTAFEVFLIEHAALKPAGFINEKLSLDGVTPEMLLKVAPRIKRDLPTSGFVIK